MLFIERRKYINNVYAFARHRCATLRKWREIIKYVGVKFCRVIVAAASPVAARKGYGMTVIK